MIIFITNLQVADNSGAQQVECIKVLGGSKKRVGVVGDTIVVAVKEALPNKKVKKGEVHKALIVRTKTKIRRLNGECVSFDSNAVVIVNNELAPVGTRIFGPIAKELRDRNHLRIVALAPNVI